MRYFILWVLFFNDGSYHAQQVFESLQECQNTALVAAVIARRQRKPWGYSCLPEGVHPRGGML